MFEEYLTLVQAIKEENKFLRDEMLERSRQYPSLEQELTRLGNIMNEELTENERK